MEPGSAAALIRADKTANRFPLEELATIGTGAKPPEGHLVDGASVAFLNGGTKPSGFVTESNTDGDTVAIPSRGSVGVVGYSADPFWCGPLCYRIRSKSPSLLTRFLFYALKVQEPEIIALQQTGSIPALNKAQLAKVRVPVPEIEVQREIVNILDKFKALEVALNAELYARRHQQGQYRSSLLTFGPEVPRLSMGRLCAIKAGQPINRIEIANNPGNYPVINSGREPLGYYHKFNTADDPIGITSRGAGVGSVVWTEGLYYRGNLNYSATILDPKVLNMRFLYHWLLHDQSSIQALCTYDGIPALNKSNLEKLQIPVPRADVQIRVAQTLDAFDALVNDLSIGLPGELAARRTQYEYYRDRLLTFQDPAA